METLDTVVIGAGVVGLAVARELALRGREVVVLEAERSFGIHASTRNSQVIHAGIYYPPGSVKARACVEGRELLYRYCGERGIPHRRTGKLLLAVNDSEFPRLANLVERAAANGAADVRLLAPGELRALEPEVRAAAAAFAPSSGIVDAHALLTSLAGDIEAEGGTLVCNSRVIDGEPVQRGMLLRVEGNPDYALQCRRVVNCGGAQAPALAQRVGTPSRLVPRAFHARGHYFALGGASPFTHLVYPMPEPGGLGIHVTLDTAGRARFGPDVQWIDALDYSFAPGLEARFRAAIERYYPAIRSRGLSADYCGVRARIAGPGQPDADFVVQRLEQHGIPGLVNLYGIDSPGLTASLAIARMVAEWP